MNEMPDLIIESADIADIEGFPDGGESPGSDLTATKAADPNTMDFHIQMRGYTMSDFEQMVVHAAAQQLVGSRSFATEIRDKAVEIANAKVNEQLSQAMRDVMGIAVQKRGAEQVTLGQMIGMEAKDYLTQPVNGRGEIDTSGYGSSRQPRAAYLVAEYVKAHFAKEIKAAMDAMLAELKPAVVAQITATVTAERNRVAAALGHEIAAKR
jgi:hypothetical protein